MENTEKIKSENLKRNVKLKDGKLVNAIGQGTWHMGEKHSEKTKEIKALQLGIDLGLTLIDTAEMYGGGGAEEVTGEAVKTLRDRIFLVSKVYPQNAGKKNAVKACENSLKRLGTDYLDLYLLHWRGSIPLNETVEAMEQLVKDGKIKRWGVSNFDKEDMEELWEIPRGSNCAVNQVLYHLGSRGIEYDLLPWCRERNVPVMAYCPVAQGGALRRELLENKIVKKIAKARGISEVQVLLAWTVRENDIISIPKAVQEKHIYENAKTAGIFLSEKEILELDGEFPSPKRKIHLDIV
jgi:diketogulonate reductase-like aldo/keto reductase